MANPISETNGASDTARRPAPKRVELARFPGGKRFALTTSWDDGPVEDRRLVGFMNDVGLKGTFNLNSSILAADEADSVQRKTVTASEVKALYAGHEVAIHTASHPHLNRLDRSQIAFEVLQDRCRLEDLVGYPVRGMAYPYGSFDEKVIDTLRGLGVVYSRTTAVVDPCFPPAEALAWGATGHMFAEGLTARIVEKFNNPKASGAFLVWGHAYEFARPTERWDDMDRILRPLAGHGEVWYCTNIELFDYEEARQRLVIAANRRTAFNPSAIDVTVICDGQLKTVPAGKVVDLT